MKLEMMEFEPEMSMKKVFVYNYWFNLTEKWFERQFLVRLGEIGLKIS